MPTISVDDHFGKWDEYPKKVTCKLAKWHISDFPNFSDRNRFNLRRLGTPKECDDIAEAAQLDLAWFNTHSEGNDKLPFSVLQALVQDMFTQRNSKIVQKFLELPPNGQLGGVAKLHAHIIRDMKGKHDDKFDENNLIKVLQDIRAAAPYVVSSHAKHALQFNLQKERAENKKRKRKAEDDKYREDKGIILKKTTSTSPPLPNVAISTSSGTGNTTGTNNNNNGGGSSSSSTNTTGNSGGNGGANGSKSTGTTGGSGTNVVTQIALNPVAFSQDINESVVLSSAKVSKAPEKKKRKKAPPRKKAAPKKKTTRKKKAKVAEVDDLVNANIDGGLALI